MELNALYNIATKENINIVNFKMKNKAIICKTDKEYCIGLNYSQIDNYSEEKNILAEELGHYYYNSYYTVNSSQIDIDRAEYRAKKWTYNVLVPFDRLRKVILSGINTTYELAEHFEVPEETIIGAIEYYKRKYGEFINKANH